MLAAGAAAARVTFGAAQSSDSTPPAGIDTMKSVDLRTPLGALAAQANLLFGASIAQEIFDDPAYRQLYLDQARIVTSDTALKFASIRPTAGAPHYEGADRLVDFAQANHLAFRGHNLIWNENNPPWVSKLGHAAIGALLDHHIETTVSRYAGRMHSWDVVNEPFWPDHGAPGGFRKGPWYNALGPAYIARALRRAAAADHTARLVINEAFTERGDDLGHTVRADLLRLIDELQHHGVPLHAIGLEAHLQPQFPADDAGFVRFLEEIARRHLDIYLTELDVDDSSLPRDTAARDEAVAQRVRAFLDHALSVPQVKILECWQLSDKYSWYNSPDVLRGRGDQPPPRPLPFDRDLRAKPMAAALAASFDARVRH